MVLIWISIASSQAIEEWDSFIRACRTVQFGEKTPEQIGRMESGAPIRWATTTLKVSASVIVSAEERHYGQEDHPERISAKEIFEQIYRDCLVAGFIEGDRRQFFPKN